MLDAAAYLEFTGYRSRNGLQGGQELLLPEIVSLFAKHESIYLPFPSSGTLAAALRERGKNLCIATDCFADLPRATALYFGTPTIVGDAPLFPLEPSAFPLEPSAGAGPWTKSFEREYVRWLCAAAQSAGYSRIVSGLGSGDIEIEERIADMGGGKIVCMKDFGEFQDWIMVRDLR